MVAIGGDVGGAVMGAEGGRLEVDGVAGGVASATRVDGDVPVGWAGRAGALAVGAGALLGAGVAGPVAGCGVMAILSAGLACTGFDPATVSSVCSNFQISLKVLRLALLTCLITSSTPLSSVAAIVAGVDVFPALGAAMVDRGGV